MRGVNYLHFGSLDSDRVQAVVLHIREQDLITVNKEPDHCIEELEELLLAISREKERSTEEGAVLSSASRKRGKVDNTIEGNRYRFVWSERTTNPRPTILLRRKQMKPPSSNKATGSGGETKEPQYRGGSMLKQTLVVRLSLLSQRKDIQSYFS
jgi:hypothetical protein